MLIIHKFQIIDTRNTKDFKTDTYNKFKKKDVIKSIMDSKLAVKVLPSILLPKSLFWKIKKEANNKIIIKP